jgi:hypothetical protein
MRLIRLLALFITLTAYSVGSFGQMSAKQESSEFCGKRFVPPSDCATIGNMIQCSNYVFSWTYEPISDLPRHQKELLAQISNPKRINVSVLNNDLVGYLSKMDDSDCLLIIGNVNGKGVIINLFLNKIIRTTADLPECVRQFITIKP